jgi:uncharacterized membrane protein
MVVGRFARPRRRLRAGLVQLVCVLAGLGLGLLLPRITTGHSVASTRVTESLVAVGFGILGLVSIIFSLLFLVVQWAFGSLSPRLNLFRDDPIVWRTFGLAIGIFVFSVTAALAIGNDPEVSVILPAAEVAAVLAAIALIRTLQVKAFASIQLAPTLSAIAARGRAVIDALYRQPCASDRQSAPLPPLHRTITWPHRQAVLQQLDLRRLLDAAGTAVIVLRARIGDTIGEGAPAADCTAATSPTRRCSAQWSPGKNVPSTRTRCSPSGCSPTSACGRYRRPSTIRPPPFRCSTPSRACCSPWPHVTWTWPR